MGLQTHLALKANGAYVYKVIANQETVPEVPMWITPQGPVERQLTEMPGLSVEEICLLLLKALG